MLCVTGATLGQGFIHHSHEAVVGDASAGSENPDTIIRTQNTDVSRDTKHNSRNKSHTIKRERSRNKDHTEDDTSNLTQSEASQVTDSCHSLRRNRNTEEQSPSHTSALECEHIVIQHNLLPPYIRPPPNPLNNISSFSVTPETITWASARSDSTDPTTSRPQESTCVNTSVSSRRFSRPSSAGQGIGIMLNTHH